MLISPLCEADIASAVELERVANQYPWSETAFNSSFSTGYFSYKLSGTTGELYGFYIGYQVLDQAELFNICVCATRQGTGNGSLLMQHFLQQCQKQGAVNVMLEVSSSNHNAIALYQKFGFKQYSLRKGYYTNAAGKADALLMQRPLVE